MDKEKIKFHIRGLLEAIGENPDREGLVDTPERVAEMYEEVFEGISYSNAEIAEMFGKTFSSEGRGTDEAVIVKDITVFIGNINQQRILDREFINEIVQVFFCTVLNDLFRSGANITDHHAVIKTLQKDRLQDPQKRKNDRGKSSKPDPEFSAE